VDFFEALDAGCAWPLDERKRYLLMDKVIVFCVDWFHPAIQAGGPINSVMKIGQLLAEKAKVYIITSNTDLDGSLLDVETGNWTDYSKNTWVCYLDRSQQSPQNLSQILRSLDCDILYLNSMFSIRFTILPTILNKFFGRAKVILAPRGMLGRGALSFKYYKKLLFLRLSLLTGFFSNMRWHASTRLEKREIEKYFPAAEVHIAKNIPNVTPQARMELHPGNARRFIFSGRINRKKNIAFALSVLSKMSVPVNVDFVIVGPIEDEQYAEEIYRLAKSAPNIRVRFLGVLNREDLFKELRQSDCFILPTLHENYGHSIVEAWANSCPVIISNQTPWENLKFTGVGWDVPLDEDRWKDAFFEFFQLDLHQRVKLSDRCRDFFQKEVYTELDNNANLTLFDL